MILRNGALSRSSSDRLSHHCHTGRVWVLSSPLVILKSGKQTPSPNLKSELAIKYDKHSGKLSGSILEIAC